MRTAIAEADDGRIMAEHVVHRIEIAVTVVGQRAIQNRLAVVFQQQVVGDVCRMRGLGALPPPLLMHRAAVRNWADRRVGRCDPICATRRPSSDVAACLGDQLAAEFRLTQDRDPLFER